MSDEYLPDEDLPRDQFARGPRVRLPTSAEMSANYAAHLAERKQNIAKYGGVELSNQEFAFLNDLEKNPERYRPNMTEKDFAILNSVFSGEQTNKEFVDNRYRVLTAIELSRLYQVPFNFAYSRYDDIIASQYEERARKDPKTAFKAVRDSFALGTNQVRLAGLGRELMELPEGEEREAVWKKIQQIKKENEELGDGVTRNWFLEGLKGLGESWAFTAKSSAAGALGGLINPALGVVSAAAVSAADLAGLEYVSLLDQGVDRDTALRIAWASGAIQGIIEAVLGDVAALGSRTGIGQMIFKKLHYSGKIGAVARAFAARPIDSLMEGAEEAAQELASQAFTELAKTETEQRFGVRLDRDTPEEKRQAVIESFKGGLLTAMVTGVPIMIREGAITARETRAIREIQIAAPDYESLTKSLDGLGAFRGMTKETKEEIFQGLWERREEEIRGAEQKRRDSGARKQFDPDEPSEFNPAPARRLEDGGLYYTTRTDDVEGDAAAASLTVGDPKTGRSYGRIDYHSDGETLEINRVDFAPYLTDREEVIRDAVVALAAENRDIKDIIWETEDPLEMDIRDRIIRENPFNKNMQWFDPDMDPGETRAAAAIAGELRKFNLDGEKTRIATHIVYRLSKNLGFNAEDIMGRALTIYTRKELEENPELAELVREGGLPENARGAAFFVRDGNTVGFNTVSREFEQGITGVIVAAETADLDTFVHEFTHFTTIAYVGRNPGMRRLLEDAMGKPFDRFTEEDHETIADGMIEYLKTRKTRYPKLRNLFERIARALAELVKGNGIVLSPRLRRYFDELMRDPESPLSKAETATKPEAATGATDASPGAASAENSPQSNEEGRRAVTLEETGNAEETIKHTPGWMKAPNGKDTNLTEGQWIQVRTPFFKDWFGDWENDPENASKAIDENGEPLVLFHGTNAEFNTFSREKQRDSDLGEGFYFSDNEQRAGDFGDRIIAAFISAKNPFITKPDTIKPDGTVEFQGSFKEQAAQIFPETASMTGKQRNDFLQKQGYDGIIHGDVYVAFSPTQIKSATDNIGTFNGDNPSMLFQIADEEIDEEAASFPSWPEWMEYAETMESPAAADETLSPEQKEAWYRNRWEKARNIKRDGNNRIVREKEVLESEEINDRFIDKLENEQGVLESFLERLFYYAFPPGVNEQVQTEEEAAARDRDVKLGDRIRHQAHTTIILNGERVAGGKKLNPAARKQILTLMERGAPWYRNFYAEIMDDPEFETLIENEVVTLPPIEEPKGRVYTIVELSRMANRVKDKQIRSKLMSGELNPGKDLTGYINRLDEEKSDLKRDLNKAEEELAGLEKKLSQEDRVIYEKLAEIKNLKETIAEKEKSVAKLEKDLAKAAADKKALKARGEWEIRRERAIAWGKGAVDKLHADQRLREEREKGKISADERGERLAKARTEREKIIESFRRRIENEYEELAQDKDKLKALRRETEKSLRGVRKEAGKDAARDVTLQKRLAVDELKAEIRAKEAEKREVRKIREIKKKYFRSIMRGHKKNGMRNIWYEEAEKIRAIQDAVNPRIKQTVIRWNGERYTPEEFRDAAVDLIDVLPKAMVKRLFKKTFDDWTINELMEFDAEIEKLRVRGRRKWQIIEDTRKMENSETIRKLRNTIAGHPDYEAAGATGSTGRNQQLSRQVRKGISGFLDTTYHFDRVTDNMDGREGGDYTRLLVDEQRELNREKDDRVDERLGSIIKKREELKIDVRSLYEKKHLIEGVGPENTAAEFNTPQLMGMFILLGNPQSREHILFGNLLNSQERDFYKAQSKIIRTMGQNKLDILSRYVNEHLTENEKLLARAVADDFKGENFLRMADVFANEYNQRLTNVQNYLPNLVTDSSGSGPHEKQQAREWLDIGGKSVKSNADKGMTVDRIKNISPWNQRAIELDIFKLHQNGVERQEHFIAFSRYVRKLNEVFRGQSTESRALAEAIEQTFGKPVMDRIKREINVFANPRSFHDANDKLIRGLRGNLGAAYLAAKTSSILQQLATSPMPFLQEVGPHEMFASAWKYLTNPRAFNENIKNLSVDMRHFSGDALFDLIHEMEETSKVKRGLKKAREIGMAGLEWANETPVFIGWNAVYEKSLREGMTKDEAVAKADKVVRKTQPSGRPEDNAPLFRDTNEATKLVTQFGTALNVIWNQISYDLPTAIKRKQWKTALRIAGSYALAGTVAMAIKNGFEDDDDDKMKAKRLIAWSFSQFSDSVPLIGDLITTQVEAAVTGEKPRYFHTEILPAAESVIKGLGYISREEFKRGAGELAEGIGLTTGLPVSGTKELYEAISEQNFQRLFGYGRKKK
jgi:hypothetical protein